ncbi:MAG: hypothetical protein CM1200mP15_21310 [Dehalococcoidia bacterium]|nr:MAG: hypothetical protein CM1200mP15_21310 [Dehalococcoidia bacterium]
MCGGKTSCWYVEGCWSNSSHEAIDTILTGIFSDSRSSTASIAISISEPVDSIMALAGSELSCKMYPPFWTPVEGVNLSLSSIGKFWRLRTITVGPFVLETAIFHAS